MTDILMPALSPSMEEGTLAKWFVAVGDAVKAGDVIAEIETDKAAMEVEAQEDGVVAALLVPAGSEGVKVNALIAQLAGEAGASTGPVAPPPLSPAVRRIVAEAQLDVSDLPGSGRGGRLTKGDVLQASREVAETAAPGPLAAADSAVSASPLARRMAKAAGLALNTLPGSGPGGRILKADVERAQRPWEGESANEAPAAASPAHAEPAHAPADLAFIPGSYELAPLDGMRKTIARRMTESFREVPHFPLTIDLEMDDLMAMRGELNDLLAPDGVKVSVNDMIIRAAALALRQEPQANASYTSQGLALHRHADIAVAVAIDGGLITPIIRAAETKGLRLIAAEMKDLAERARAKRLRPEEFQGGTFSISNLGMFGVKSFSSILNAPQGAILSVGAAEPRPVARDGALAIATVSSMTLTCDHRAMDGVIGARFLVAFRRLLGEPLRLLG